MKNRLTMSFAAAPLALVLLLTVCDASPLGVPGPTVDPLPGDSDAAGAVRQDDCTQIIPVKLDDLEVREPGTACGLES